MTGNCKLKWRLYRCLVPGPVFCRPPRQINWLTDWNGQRIVSKGRIAVFSPLAAANGFVRPWLHVIGSYTVLWAHKSQPPIMAYPPGGRGTCPPDIRPRGQSCKSPPRFWHTKCNSRFTSQSLGLPAYAFKTDSCTAIKLALRMHQNLPFWAQKIQKNSG